MRKLIATVIMSVLFYLIQVCVMPYLPIASITGNILLAFIAVVAVTYSPYFAYIAGVLTGVLTEIMLAPFVYFNLILYPVLALLGAYAFADKNERRVERERSLGREGKNISPYIRIPLCAAVMSLFREVINRVYIYLGGTPITMLHVSRAATAIIYTAFLAAVIMLPVRRALGIRRKK